jgi:hypothetical protein
LQGCPDLDDDDSVTPDDDDVLPDDDDSVAADDDDVLPDDDDSVTPDDDDSVVIDDDDVLPDDDDSVVIDDDDVLPDDDDSVVIDDDDALPDDDDSVVVDDDDVVPDDDDSAASPTCYPDPSEPNNSMADAYPLGPAAIFFNVVCLGDDDWYSLDALAGQLVTAGTDFVVAEGDVAMDLYDSTGALVDTSNGSTDSEAVSWVTPVDQQMFSRVYLVADTGAFTGTFYGVGQWVCTTDSWEPNDDLGSAALLPGQVSEFSLSLCSEEAEDWYLAPLSTGDLLEVRVSFAADDGDLDLYLYDPAGNQILTGLNETSIETLVHHVTSPGDYAIRVLIEPDDLGVGHVYDLDVNFALAPSTCEPDVFEPNDDPASAPSITSTVYEGFTSCSGEDDLFAIDVVGGDTVELSLDFNHAEGDLDLFLEDASGVQLAAATSAADDEQLSWPVPSDDTLFARVVLAADAGGVPGNLYGLSLSGTTPVCIEDIYEPDDDPSTATVMANGTFRDLTICPTDDDWYELSLNHLEELILDIGYEADEGNVDILLWDPTLSSVLASGSTLDDDEQFTWIVTASDTYFVQVSLVADAGSAPGNMYDLGVVSVPSTTCSPDSYEPNDDPSSAWPMPDGSWSGLTVCEGEPDFFVLQATDAGVIDVSVEFDQSDGDIDLYLYGPFGNLLASATSVDDDEVLAWATSSGGDHVLEVVLAADAGPTTGNSYAMTLSVP